MIEAIPRFAFWLGCLFIAQLSIRPVAGLTLSDLFFGLALLSLLSVVFLKGCLARVRIPEYIYLPIVLVAIGGLLSAFGKDIAYESAGIIARFLSATIVLFALSSLILRKPSHLRYAIAFWLASAALNGLAAIAQAAVDPAIIPGVEAQWGRMTGFTQHVNDLGGSSAVALIPGVALLLEPGRFGIFKTIITALIGFAFAGLMLSGSLGSLTAFAAGLAALFLVRRATNRAIFRGLLLFAVIGTVFVWYSGPDLEGVGSNISRTFGVTAGESTVSSRFETFKAALASIYDSPLLGVGPLPGGAITESGHPVHNMFLGAWYESGVLGGLGLAFFVIVTVSTSFRTARRFQGSVNGSVLAGLFGSYVAFLVYGQGAPVLFQRYCWFSFALFLAAMRMEHISVLRSEVPPPSHCAFPRARRSPVSGSNRSG